MMRRINDLVLLTYQRQFVQITNSNKEEVSQLFIAAKNLTLLHGICHSPARLVQLVLP